MPSSSITPVEVAKPRLLHGVAFLLGSSTNVSCLEAGIN
jgi:hypothetical protein